LRRHLHLPERAGRRAGDHRQPAVEAPEMKIRRIPLSAWIGLFGLVVFFGAAILAPVIAPYGEAELVGNVWEPFSAQFWLGTDNLGRDLFSRLLYGARMTIFVAAAATVLSF